MISGLCSKTLNRWRQVIFGEIVPQALCQRYSLEVGNASVEVVRVIMVILFPVAFPLSYCLDLALGEELATTYSNAEMLKLLEIHVEERKIDPDTAIAMQGALKYKSTTVKEVMTPLENMFMISSEEQLNFESIAKIFKSGYSRIPVYSIDKVRKTNQLYSSGVFAGLSCPLYCLKISERTTSLVCCSSKT